LVTEPSWRDRVAADFARFLRDDAELVSVHGTAVAGETRVNPDATLDISRWSRPQHDGPPLRALALLRWMRSAALDMALVERISRLVHADLAFTLGQWHEPSFDIWEEERGLHYYTLRVSAAALEEGATWLEARGDVPLAQSCRMQAQNIEQTLDGYWLAEEGHYRSRVLADGSRSAKELDIAVILAAIHVSGESPVGVAPGAQKACAHTARDPRMHATLARLEATFDAQYPINRNRSTRMGPAMGRYPGDTYYSGGAYYFSTLGAAEFCFRAAQWCEPAQSWIERGDAFLQTVRAFTPANGDMSEQFDQQTGAQTSARHLAWSYAAFISSVAARRAVVGRV
jgi:glucoamylase